MQPDRLRVNVGPGEVAVTRYGHGERAVLLLHGFPLSSFAWRAVAPVIARAGWMVVCPDLLGHGESDRPIDAGLGPVSQARWMRELLGALELPRVAVVGHDLGALVGCALAATAPGVVTQLALVSPLVPEAMPPDDVGLMQRETGRLAMRLAGELVGAAELLDPLLRGRTLTPELLDARVVARATAPFVGREGVRQLLALARALEPGAETEVALEAIRVPTLVLRGEGEGADESGPVSRFVRAIAGARIERLPGASGLAPEEAPVALAATLVTFLSSYVTGAAPTGARSANR